MSEFSVQIKQPVIITGNFDEMKKELSTMMTAYAGLEVTEDNLPERKKDVATLRKIKTAIEDKRKAAKKDYQKPFEAFEKECKALTGIIDKEIDRINEDLSAYEKKRIEAKRERILAIYEANIGEYGEYLPLESIYRKQWENKTCTEQEILSDIQENVIAVKKDLGTIDLMCQPWAEECKAVYMVTGLNGALQRYKDLQTAKEAAEAAVKAAEQQTPTDVPLVPENPVQGRETASKRHVFEVYVDSDEDATFLRITLESTGFEYKEI